LRGTRQSPEDKKEDSPQRRKERKEEKITTDTRRTPNMGISKYKTGMYYKTCLYSDSDNWVKGDAPGTKGELLAAICINKATKQVDIAVDKRFEFSKLFLKIYGKLEEAFGELGVDKMEQMEYEMLYQTPSGTRMMPVLNPYEGKFSVKRLLEKVGMRGFWICK
jgi:hypothetical protein